MSKRRGEEKKRNQAELKRKQDKARNKIKNLEWIFMHLRISIHQIQ